MNSPVSKPRSAPVKKKAAQPANAPVCVLRAGQHLVLLVSEMSAASDAAPPRAFVMRGTNRIYLGAGPVNGTSGYANGCGAVLVAAVPAIVKSVRIDFGSSAVTDNPSTTYTVLDSDDFFQSTPAQQLAAYRGAVADMMTQLKTPSADLDALLNRFPQVRLRSTAVSKSRKADATQNTPVAVVQSAEVAGQGHVAMGESVPTQIPGSFKFQVDPLNGNVIEGWLWNGAAPEKRYEVQAWSDGVLVAYAQATDESGSAQKAGLQTRDVGFKLELPAFLQDGSEHAIELKVTHKSADGPALMLPGTQVYRSDLLADVKPELSMLMDAKEDAAIVSQLLARSSDSATCYLYSHVAPKLSLPMRKLEFPQSKALLDFASKSGNPQPYFAFKTGELLLLRSQWKKAEALFSAILKQTPSSVNACVGLAHALNRQGLRDKAKEALKLGLKLDSSHRGARLLLVKVECKNALEKSDASFNWSGLLDGLKNLWPRYAGDSEFEDLLAAVFDRQSGVADPSNGASGSSDEYRNLRKARRLLELAMTLNAVTQAAEKKPS